ncbi:hypothetical protein D3C86_2040400 [compost metagenome]
MEILRTAEVRHHDGLKRLHGRGRHLVAFDDETQRVEYAVDFAENAVQLVGHRVAQVLRCLAGLRPGRVIGPRCAPHIGGDQHGGQQRKKHAGGKKGPADRAG